MALRICTRFIFVEHVEKVRNARLFEVLSRTHLVARAALRGSHEAVFQQERQAIPNDGSAACVSLSPDTGNSGDNHLV